MTDSTHPTRSQAVSWESGGLIGVSASLLGDGLRGAMEPAPDVGAAI